MTFASLQAVRLSYFGKLPAHGDFLKAGHDSALIETLDDWLAASMALFGACGDWKPRYDGASPQHFALLATHRPLVVAGNLYNSRDQSGRRFPFMGAASLVVEQPSLFAARSPLALARLWTLDSPADHDAAQLRRLTATRLDCDTDATAYTPYFEDFIRHCSLKTLAQWLQEAGHDLQLPRALCGLGLLLQPLRQTGAEVRKGLALPLPADRLVRFTVASFWLELILPFLGTAERELALLIDVGTDRPQLRLGFHHNPPQLLRTALDPALASRQFLDLGDSGWVDAQLQGNTPLQALHHRLSQDNCSLRQLRSALSTRLAGAAHGQG